MLHFFVKEQMLQIQDTQKLILQQLQKPVTVENIKLKDVTDRQLLVGFFLTTDNYFRKKVQTAATKYYFGVECYDKDGLGAYIFVWNLF